MATTVFATAAKSCVRRWKICALLLMFGGVLLLMFLPGLLAGSPIRVLAALYFETFLLVATFLARACSWLFRPRPRAGFNRRCECLVAPAFRP